MVGLRGVMQVRCGCYRRLRPVRRRPHRQPTGEVSVCARGVRSYSVPEPADTFRQTATTTTFTAHGLSTSHRTTVLCATCRQNANRNSHQRHAA